VGAVVRSAGIVHMAEHGPEVGSRTTVTVETVLAASRIGEVFKACAITAFTDMGADHVTADLIYLLERINGIGEDEVSERDFVYRRHSRQVQDDDRPDARAGAVCRLRLRGADASAETHRRPLCIPRLQSRSSCATAAKHAQG